jgi:hypothetical protein
VPTNSAHPADKQKAKGKPFARIATAAGAFMFLFNTEQDRDEAVDCMSQPEKAQQASKQALDFIPPPDIRKLIFNDDECAPPFCSCCWHFGMCRRLGLAPLLWPPQDAWPTAVADPRGRAARNAVLPCLA